MDIKTYLAVGELVQRAAHQHGVVGPVEFTVCRPHELEMLDTAESGEGEFIDSARGIAYNLVCPAFQPKL